MEKSRLEGDKGWVYKILPSISEIKTIGAFLFAVATGMILISSSVFTYKELVDDVKHQETRLFVQNQLIQQRLEIKSDMMEAVNIIKTEVGDKVSKTELENAILTQTLKQTMYTKDEVDSIRLELRDTLNRTPIQNQPK